MSAFDKHSGNVCHSEAVMAIEVLPVQLHDIGELLNTHHEKEKSVNRDMFLRILEYVRDSHVKVWPYEDMTVAKIVTLVSCYSYDHLTVPKLSDGCIKWLIHIVHLRFKTSAFS